MNLTKREMQTAKEALGYAVMFAKTESETAEFAMLKIKIESELLRIEQAKIPETCPMCNKKCTGFSESINFGVATDRTYFHSDTRIPNCKEKF